MEFHNYGGNNSYNLNSLMGVLKNYGGENRRESGMRKIRIGVRVV